VSVIRAIGFHGIAGALEFKRHPRTGRLHFIEINARPASQIGAARASGVNLPHLAYLDAIGAELPEMAVGEGSVRWIDARRDVLYWVSYRKGDHTGQPLPLREYLGSLQGRRDYAYWVAGDPMPAVARAASLPRDIWLGVRTAARRCEVGDFPPVTYGRRAVGFHGGRSSNRLVAPRSRPRPPNAVAQRPAFWNPSVKHSPAHHRRLGIVGRSRTRPAASIGVRRRSVFHSGPCRVSRWRTWPSCGSVCCQTGLANHSQIITYAAPWISASGNDLALPGVEHGLRSG
jgi:hypothetical protein